MKSKSAGVSRFSLWKTARHIMSRYASSPTKATGIPAIFEYELRFTMSQSKVVLMLQNEDESCRE
jgi:hypothetical protein